MKCKKARKLINDYIDNNLKPKQKMILEQHLESCEECKKFLMDFKKIVNGAKNLEILSPSGNLWLKIQNDLEKGALKRKKWLTIFLRSYPLRYKIAFVSLLIFITSVSIIGVFYHYKKENKIVPYNKYVLTKLEEAEHHYELAIKSLQEAFSLIKCDLDPQIVRNFQENMKIIDASINDFRKIVQKEPYNFEARMYLLSAYQQKVNFFQEIINLKKTSPAGGFNPNI